MDTSRELKLVLVGNTSVGKTCVVKKATTGTFGEDSVPTLGAAYVSKIVNVDNTEVRLQIWDTAGQERYRGMTPMYYRGAHCALIVYSVTDQESYDSIDSWVQSLHDNADSEIILFLIANKADMENERVVSTQNGTMKASSIGATFYEVSAKTGLGIDDLFQEIPSQFLAKNPSASAAQADTVQLKDQEGNKKKGKCCK